MKPIQVAGPDIREEDIEFVSDAIRNLNGPKPYYYVEQFEAEFAEYVGRKYALMTPNCTSAIHLVLRALDIGEHDEVIIPELTWIATIAPVFYQKAEPVLCDVSLDSWCAEQGDVSRAMSLHTKAAIVVDLCGNMPNWERLEKLQGIYLIEDSAQALGSKYNGKPAGSFGIASAFSFHRTKTIAAGTEGGMLVLDDETLYKRCSALRDHGRSPSDKLYRPGLLGYKYTPNSIAAALAYAQFKRLDELVAKKRYIMNFYKSRLDSLGLRLNQDDDVVYNGAWVTGATWDSQVSQKDKEQVMGELAQLGVPPRPLFYPLSSVPGVYEMFPKYGVDPYTVIGYYQKQNTRAYYLGSHGLNLPCAYSLDDEQLDFICGAVEKVFSH